MKSRKNLQIFHSKSRKIAKIDIHGFLGSQKWWNMNSSSCSFHVNFDHGRSLIGILHEINVGIKYYYFGCCTLRIVFPDYVLISCGNLEKLFVQWPIKMWQFYSYRDVNDYGKVYLVLHTDVIKRNRAWSVIHSDKTVFFQIVIFTTE